MPWGRSKFIGRKKSIGVRKARLFPRGDFAGRQAENFASPPTARRASLEILTPAPLLLRMAMFTLGVSMAFFQSNSLNDHEKCAVITPEVFALPSFEILRVYPKFLPPLRFIFIMNKPLY